MVQTIWYKLVQDLENESTDSKKYWAKIAFCKTLTKSMNRLDKQHLHYTDHVLLRIYPYLGKLMTLRQIGVKGDHN